MEGKKLDFFSQIILIPPANKIASLTILFEKFVDQAETFFSFSWNERKTDSFFNKNLIELLFWTNETQLHNIAYYTFAKQFQRFCWKSTNVGETLFLQRRSKKFLSTGEKFFWHSWGKDLLEVRKFFGTFS